jgi:protein-L-isoaspartate(D-aspartate) O-methyltransferase
MDEALPIGFKQTISQPYVVAMMTQALALTQGDRVLDVGTGSGYQGAILAGLCAEVLTMEVVPELSSAARARIKDLGIENVRFVIGDGSLGLSDYARFDGIIVAAAAPDAPPPLLEQLADGGRMVIPIGSSREQRLTLIKKVESDLIRTDLGSVRFVPLVGPHGLVDP